MIASPSHHPCQQNSREGHRDPTISQTAADKCSEYCLVLKIPIGTIRPNIHPPDVARAKHLRHQIIDKMDGTDLNELEDDAEDDEEDPDTIFWVGVEAIFCQRGAS